jgi:PBP1b-binding outer membrane lipoprotein LpoB
LPEDEDMNRLKTLLVVCVLLAGCASAPVQEMSDARQAIQSAREVGADDLLPGVLTGAERHLERAEKDLEARAYGSARRHALAAKEEAIRVREQAEKLRD